MVNASRRAGPVWAWALGLIVLIVLVWILVAARSAAAQQPDVLRQAFPLIGTDLTVELHVEAPGAINIVRGDPGRVQLLARAPDGLAAAGLARKPRHRLNISALGTERVDVVLVVPAGVRVNLRLPDRPVAEVFGTLQDAATYSWGDPPALPAAVPSPGAAQPAGS